MTETTTKKTEVASVLLKGGTQRRNGIEKLEKEKADTERLKKEIAQDKEKREKEELERQKKEKREKGRISWKKVRTERIKNW